MSEFASLYHFAEVNPLTPAFNELDEEAQIPFMPLENVWAYGKANYSSHRNWKRKDTSYTQFQKGDILVPKVTPTVFHGRSMIAEIDSELGLATSEVHVLRTKQGVEPRWVLYNMLSGKFLDEARGAVTGVGGLQRISSQYLCAYKVRVVPLATQRRIADRLDRETGEIDLLVKELDEYVELLERRKKAAIAEELKGSKSEKIPLGLLANVFQSNIDKKSKEGEILVELLNYTDVYYNDTIRLNLPFMKATATQEQIDRLRLKIGDVVITKDSETADDIGIPAHVLETKGNFVCGYHLSVVRPDGQKLDSRYLYWCMKSKETSEYWEQRANGVTRVSIPSQTVTSLGIPLPDLETQRRIAERLDRETAETDALIKECTALKELLLKRRQVLITDMVTGKVEV